MEPPGGVGSKKCPPISVNRSFKSSENFSRKWKNSLEFLLNFPKIVYWEGSKLRVVYNKENPWVYTLAGEKKFSCWGIVAVIELVPSLCVEEIHLHNKGLNSELSIIKKIPEFKPLPERRNLVVEEQLQWSNWSHLSGLKKIHLHSRGV